jgi:predicted GIY-YIG superfamily endonuclease
MNEAILYIIYSPLYKSVKIGISDISGKRFAAHRQKGWLLVSYWHFFERDKAKAVESLVLQTLRDKHGSFLSKEDMPQHGYTETFDSRKVSKRGLIRMVNKAIKSVNDKNSH